LNITCMFTLNNIESYLELIQGNVKDEVWEDTLYYTANSKKVVRYKP
jgi:hypothetical protein